MEAVRHSLLDNAVQLYMRPKSPYWNCSCSIGGRQIRSTTKEESLARAKDVARDWYLSLMGKYRAGELKQGKKFKEAAAHFIDEFEALTQGARSDVYVAGHRTRIKNHLNPIFGEMVMPEITDGTIQDYRVHRMKTGLSRIDQFRKAKFDKEKKAGKHGREEFQRSSPPSRTALHQEIVCLRQIFKNAKRKGWMTTIPDLSAPYRASGKVEHRAWFSLEEYRKLYQATKRRSQKPPNPRWGWACKQMHDFVLFMANTGLRPDEAYRLQFRDVSIIDDEATKETILLIQVRGKRGVGMCKSMSNAVRPFERLRDRERRSSSGSNTKALAKPLPTDLIFPGSQHELFNAILDEEGLKFDRENQRRTAYSLRHTYICFRLLEGADIYQIAKNCRTSVEMIQKYYASHIESDLDATAINVLKSRKMILEDDDEGDAKKGRPKSNAKSNAKAMPAKPSHFGKRQY